MMTKISHIVTNGCSFTYGSELENPRNEAWPRHVAESLGVPVVNIACSSIGNDAIHRRTYEYFYEDLKNENNPLYIIGFSQFIRREYWTQKEKFYKGIHIGDTKISDMDIAQQEYLENYNEEDLYRKTLIYKLSLRNLFVSHNIPYLFVDMMRTNGTTDAREICIEKLPGISNEVETDRNNIGQIYDKLSNPVYCKYGHFDAPTNQQVANVITNALRQRYALQITPSEKFLTVLEYSSQLEPEKFKNYLWQQHYGAWT